MPETAILLVIDSDLALGEELSRIEVQASRPGSEDEPATAEFAVDNKGAASATRLPLSLAIAARSQSSRETVRIVVTGYGPLGADGEEIAVVEQKASAQFVPDKLIQLNISLSVACLQQLCSDAEQTCSPVTGKCVPTPRYDDLPEAEGDGREGFVWTAAAADGGDDALGAVDTEDGSDNEEPGAIDDGPDAAPASDPANVIQERDDGADGNTDAEAPAAGGSEGGPCEDGYETAEEGECLPVLRSLSISVGQLVPEFDPLITEYTVDANKWDAVARVTAEHAPGVLLSVDGASAQDVELQPGDNEIEVVADFGTTKWTYHLSVHRPAVRTAYLPAPNENTAFGRSVALSGRGNTLAVGAPIDYSCAVGANATPRGYDDERSCPRIGAVHVYARDGAGWEPEAFIKPETSAFEGFGFPLGLSSDGHTLVTTGIAHATPAQTANLATFFTTSTGWLAQPVDRLWSLPRHGGIAISGDGRTLVIGDPEDGSCSSRPSRDEGCVESGGAYVFARSGSGWSQEAYLRAQLDRDTLNIVNDAHFGASVSISTDGRFIAIGAPGEGSAYLYQRSSTGWPFQDRYASTMGRDLGRSIALNADGTVMASGGPNHVAVVTRSGGSSKLAYVLEERKRGANSVALDATGDVLVATDGDGVLVIKGYSAGSSEGPKSVVELHPLYDDTFVDSVAVSADGDRIAVGASNVFTFGAVYIFE